METIDNTHKVQANGKSHFNLESHVVDYFTRVTARPAFTQWRGDVVQNDDLPIRISGKFDEESFDHEIITELTVHCLQHQKHNTIALLRRLADELERI